MMIIESQRNDIYFYYYLQDGHCDEAQAWRRSIWRCLWGNLEEIQRHHCCQNAQGEFDYTESDVDDHIWKEDRGESFCFENDDDGNYDDDDEEEEGYWKRVQVWELGA